MSSRPKRPKRPFRNLDEFRRSIAWRTRQSEDTGFWPCLECRARGFYYNPDDCCPIEGYKLATRYKCPKCGGSCKGTKKEVTAAYRQVIAEWQAEDNTWKAEEALRKSGLDKLTEEERKALRL
jgi:hypothetical protein